MNLRAAVNAKCKECIYDPVTGKGTWRQQVAACRSTQCPLYWVRPMRNRRSEAAKAANLPIKTNESAMAVLNSIIPRTDGAAE